MRCSHRTEGDGGSVVKRSLRERVPWLLSGTASYTKSLEYFFRL